MTVCSIQSDFSKELEKLYINYEGWPKFPAFFPSVCWAKGTQRKSSRKKAVNTMSFQAWVERQQRSKKKFPLLSSLLTIKKYNILSIFSYLLHSFVPSFFVGAKTAQTCLNVDPGQFCWDRHGPCPASETGLTFAEVTARLGIVL